MTADRRRSQGRRLGDGRECVFALFLGFAYGVVLTALLYAWILPIVR